MKFIKYSEDKEKLQKVVDEDERYQRVSKDAALVMDVMTASELRIKEEREEAINMGNALTEIREEGREEGRQEGLRQTSHNLFKLGMSIPDIAKIVEIDEEKVTDWITSTK